MWKKYRLYRMCVFPIFIVFLIGAFFLSKKLTYLENTYLTYSNTDYFAISSVDMKLSQQFEMPYNLFSGVSVKIGTYGKDNNSLWKVDLRDNKGNVCFTKQFTIIDAIDQDYYTIKANRAIAVNKGERYVISIQALSVNEQSKVAFYTSSDRTKIAENSELFRNIEDNIEDTENVLCMSILGGDKDVWWILIFALFIIIVAVLFIRIINVKQKGKDWKLDPFICSIIIGIVIIMLLYPYADTKVMGIFTDENDNIRGGMLIANGAVLYRDYIVQHMPVTYYMCAIFSLLGASSVEQMRIMYYFVVATFWAFMYFRHHRVFGRKTMILIPILVTLFINVIIGSQGAMILADSIQGFCMILLLLEFLMYYRDRKLNWGRCIIISLGVWGALGSVFISAYGICILMIGFIVCEFNNSKSNGVNIFFLLNRYMPLALCGIIPLIIGIIYFTLNQALRNFYEQAYLFNREIYPHYQNMGNDLIEPFFLGISSLFSQFINSLLIFTKGNLTIYDIVVVSIVCVLISLMARKGIKEVRYMLLNIFLIVYICTGASRGVTQFHALPFWGMLLTIIIILYKDDEVISNNKRSSIIIAVYLCIILQPIITAYDSKIGTEQPIVSNDESKIIAYTVPGEEIYSDTYVLDSIYLLYKERYPASRLTYALPWYMDWFEDITIVDVIESRPRFVVWNPNTIVWERQYFCDEFNSYINSHYTRTGQDSILWIINEEYREKE